MANRMYNLETAAGMAGIIGRMFVRAVGVRVVEAGATGTACVAR